MPIASDSGPRRTLSIGLAALLTLALVLLFQLAGFGMALIRSMAKGVRLEDAARALSMDPVTLGVLQAAVVGGILFLGLRIVGRDRPTRETLHVYSVPRATIVLCLVGGGAMQLPLAELSNLVQELSPIPMDVQLAQYALVNPDNWIDGFGAVFAFALVAPVGEELFFRGLVLPGLLDRHRPATAVVVSGVLFGAAHFGYLATALPAAVAGLILGALMVRTGSVLPAMAAHVGNNGLVLLLPERLVRIEGLNTVGEEVYHLEPYMVISALVLMTGCLGWVALSAKETSE